MRSAIGESVRIWRHHATVSRSRSSSGDHGVDETPVERRRRVVLATEKPDFLRALEADGAREQRRTVSAVKGTDPRAGLTESSVVGRDREIAHQVQDVPSTDGVSRHLGDDGLRQPTNLNLQVEHVEPADAVLGHVVVADVAVVASDALVAA